jgi:threonine synthase
MSVLQCTDCQGIVESLLPKYRCPSCGGLLEYRSNYERMKEAIFKGEFTFWRYRDVLPKVKNPATMREGGTPLHMAERLAKEMDLNRLYLKD